MVQEAENLTSKADEQERNFVMSNKVECVRCHGTGELPCDTCNGEGKLTCPDCEGKGVDFSICPNCHEGRVLDPRGVKDDDTMPCPTCHGNYKTENGKCKTCGGSGKIDCAACEGKGKKWCDFCDDGDGEWDAADFCEGYLDDERGLNLIYYDDSAKYDEMSFAQLMKIADTGYAEACFIVACCYDGGAKATDDGRLAWGDAEGLRTIVNNDLVKAEKYYRMCADNATTTVQGERGRLLTAAAQKCLGRMLLKKSQDDARKRDGIEWLKKAAENDCERALLWMAFISIGGVSGLDGLKSDPEKALSYFKRYLECDPWGPQTIEMVKEYIEKLPKAVNGDVSAILDLAKIHEDDEASYYDESSLSDLTGSFSDLESYWLGQAARKDYAPAMVKLEKAAAGGNDEAKKRLGEILAKYNCKTCRDKGTVTCPTCGGKKEFECSNCHGKGHLDSCADCGSTGKVACSTCEGSGKVGVDCPVCDHGKVKKTRWINCKLCKGTGSWKDPCWEVCEECGDLHQKGNGFACRHCGSGKFRPIAKTCSRCDGRGQVKETYSEICPACHGDYKGYKGEKSCGSCGGTGKRTCSSCNGSGKKKCEKCGGRGKVECSQCHGAGSVKCPECQKREEEAAAAKAKREAAEKKRRAEAAAAEKRRKEKAAAAERERTRASYKSHGTFVTLGFLFGLMGVHFAYIGRWCLFLVQLALTGCGVAQIFVPAINDWVQNLMMPCSMKLNELGWPWLGLAVQYPTLVLAGLWCLGGILFVIKDGTNHKMKRSSNANLVMYVLIFILQVWLICNLADVKWPKTLTWGILETVGAMIILNLHFLFAGLATNNDDVCASLVLNVLLAGIAAGMNVFLPESIITSVLGVVFVVIYVWTSFKAGKKME